MKYAKQFDGYYDNIADAISFELDPYNQKIRSDRFSKAHISWNERRLYRKIMAYMISENKQMTAENFSIFALLYQRKLDKFREHKSFDVKHFWIYVLYRQSKRLQKSLGKISPKVRKSMIFKDFEELFHEAFPLILGIGFR